MMLLEERPASLRPRRDIDRLLDVARLGLDREQPRPFLQRVVDEVAEALHAPIAVADVLLDDVQVFAALHGPAPQWLLDAGGTPIEWSFCRPFLTERRPRIVRDLREDPRWSDNPLVTGEGARAYIGVPLISRRGHVLGGLCALDLAPRDFAGESIGMLERRAAEIIDNLESEAAAEL
ncbi:GAF domain-containing protein [Actinoplanes sp. NPDC049596]|uniref:GAF domain-containing protein n=1 Tax=unclassified Actinoplanes TaxID=2626549 RepID=UPI00342E2B20